MCTSFSLALLAAASALAPAHAGQWQFTLFAPTVVAAASSLSSLTITPTSVTSGQNAKGTVTLSNPASAGGANVTLSAGTGSVSVPANVVVRAGSASADFLITTSPGSVSTTSSITAVYSGSSLTTELTLLPAPPTATLTVDQDQQVFAPAATTRFSATISNASDFTIDSVKISVDGTPTTATVDPSNPNNYFINWPSSSALNPSEHKVTAMATIHNSTKTLSLNSTDPAGRTSAPSGMGRAADDIIADVCLKSIKFNSNIALNQDTVTPVPSPEITWTGTNIRPTTSNSAAYIQGQKVNFTMLLASSSGAALTGSAPLGYGLKLQANPNTTNPSTNQADPTLTLYDNTVPGPFTPTSCGSSTTIAATAALDTWVAPYTTSFPVLMFYVKFTQVPTPFWISISSYNGTGNMLYATVATPTAPMATPWVGVLADACGWAKRTSDAVTASKSVCNNFYANAKYSPTRTWYTDGSTSPETFHLLNFLNKTLGASQTLSGLEGQCNDFSDFLCCLSNSLGAVSLETQRSSSGFPYSNVTFAPDISSPAQANTFAYHQWTTDGTATSGNIYDSAVRPTVTTVTPPVDELLAQYLNWLSPGANLAGLSPINPLVTN